MKLGILSCSPHCYSTRRLKEAAVERGHKVRVLNTLKFAIDLNPGSPIYLLQQTPQSLRRRIATYRSFDHLLWYSGCQAV